MTYAIIHVYSNTHIKVNTMAVLLSFRAEDSIKSLLDAFATKTHLTKTQIINDALATYLNSVDNKIVNQVNLLRKIDKDDDYLDEAF